MNEYIAEVLEVTARRNAGEPEFLQAVREVLETLSPVVERHKKYKDNRILERIVEPERQIMFRVAWTDDKGRVQVNRGFRIQFNSAIGPYKGGIRLHPSVNIGILKFLGFEQVFKNSLTTLPMGGGKGGSDFDPKGKSDAEVMRFCQSVHDRALQAHRRRHRLPAGDIGTGGREIGYMFGQYKRIRNEFTGVLTGKGLKWGGSLIRPEATGYGNVYFAQEMLKTPAKTSRARSARCPAPATSPSTPSRSSTSSAPRSSPSPTPTAPSSTRPASMPRSSRSSWSSRRQARPHQGLRRQVQGAQYLDGQRPWGVKCDCAFPSATQNEVTGEEAKTLIKNGCKLVSEGANMPSNPDAIEAYIGGKILYGPAKAANAGGVATSGLEMSQNSMRLSWTREEVDQRSTTS
jgi:glutamate dehydrogenase (NADP+)